MVDRNILSLHDRIDEEHFELHMLKSAVRALQERVNLLEAEVRELRREASDREAAAEVLRDTQAPVRSMSSRRS
jgi:hypothetical protein